MIPFFAGALGWLIGAAVTKAAVWLLSPNSPNGFGRAVLVNLAIVVGSLGIAVVGSGLPPVLTAAALIAWPFVALKVGYGMSFFRSVLVALVIFALLYALQSLLSGTTRTAPAEIDGSARAAGAPASYRRG